MAPHRLQNGCLRLTEAREIERERPVPPLAYKLLDYNYNIPVVESDSRSSNPKGAAKVWHSQLAPPFAIECHAPAREIQNANAEQRIPGRVCTVPNRASTDQLQGPNMKFKLL